MIRNVTYAYTQEYIQLLGAWGWCMLGGEMCTFNHTSYSILHTGPVMVRRRRRPPAVWR